MIAICCKRNRQAFLKQFVWVVIWVQVRSDLLCKDRFEVTVSFEIEKYLTMSTALQRIFESSCSRRTKLICTIQIGGNKGCPERIKNCRRKLQWAMYSLQPLGCLLAEKGEIEEMKLLS